MLKKQHLSYAIISGILLSLPWLERCSGIFLWVAFVPLLLVEDDYHSTFNKPKKELFLYASLTFLTWNILTTWWLVNATFVGACALIMMNTFLFSLVFWLYHITRKIAGNIIGGVALVAYWTAFEYFYLNAEISWPWLNLGNGFANDIRLIQWYEYTGTLGGTVWVLLANVLITAIALEYIKHRNFNALWKRLIALSLLILVPVIISVKQYDNYSEKANPYKIVVIQPNIDPYNDKFGGMSPDQQLNIILQKADSIGNKSVDYFVGPETAIQGYNLESEINNNWAVNKIRTYLQHYPKAKFIIGSETIKEYSPGEKLSGTAHKLRNTEVWYDNYNTALQSAAAVGATLMPTVVAATTSTGIT